MVKEVSESSEQHSFEPDKKVARKPLERYLPRKNARGKYFKLEYGMQDTFLEDQVGDRLPPVPFHGGRPMQPVDREEAENQDFQTGATSETISAARKQRYAIRRNIERKNASGK